MGIPVYPYLNIYTSFTEISMNVATRHMEIYMYLFLCVFKRYTDISRYLFLYVVIRFMEMSGHSLL